MEINTGGFNKTTKPRGLPIFKVAVKASIKFWLCRQEGTEEPFKDFQKRSPIGKEEVRGGR